MKSRTDLDSCLSMHDKQDNLDLTNVSINKTYRRRKNPLKQEHPQEFYQKQC